MFVLIDPYLSPAVPNPHDPERFPHTLEKMYRDSLDIFRRNTPQTALSGFGTDLAAVIAWNELKGSIPD